MLVDLLNSNNYGRYNIKLAQYFGLETAVYCQILIDIFEKASRKNKLTEDGFFKVDRKYIFSISSIIVESQLKIDDLLQKLNVLYKEKDSPDSLKLDLQLLMSIITSDDTKLLSDISSKIRIKTKRELKETKQQAIINNLKDGIVCSNYELLTALRNWVDAIFENPKGGYLSKTAIQLFQNTLNNYTKGDLDLALRLVEIATIQCYKDCNWAIQIYEKDLKLKKIAESKLPRITAQKVDSKEDLDTTQVF